MHTFIRVSPAFGHPTARWRTRGNSNQSRRLRQPIFWGETRRL